MQTFYESPPSTLNRMENMPKDKSGESPKMIGVRPTLELRKALEQAREATGSDLTELVIECVRESLPSVVQRILKERQRSASTFLRDRKAA